MGVGNRTHAIPSLIAPWNRYQCGVPFAEPEFRKLKQLQPRIGTEAKTVALSSFATFRCRSRKGTNMQPTSLTIRSAPATSHPKPEGTSK
jgi:hypothetical protein